MAKTITIIAKRWHAGCAVGDLSREIFTTGDEDAAKDKARARLCAPGVCVIVKPDFNDRDPGHVDGYLFHEWRSFDGGPWEYCSFSAQEPGPPSAARAQEG